MNMYIFGIFFKDQLYKLFIICNEPETLIEARIFAGICLIKITKDVQLGFF